MAIQELTSDYVVIGSGAGGGPVATRLAEAGFSVIVIEAGGDLQDDLTYKVPAFHAHASEDPDMAWNFFVRHYDNPEQAVRDPKYVQDRGGVLYPRCSAVGGCTAHNAMIIIRPNDSDWDAIADMTGDPSWSAARMATYFERLERCTYSPIRRIPMSRWLAALLRAIPIIRDQFGPNGHGFSGWLPTSIANPWLITHDLQLLWVVARAAQNQLKQTLGRRLRWRESLLGPFDPNDSNAQKTSMLGAWLVPLSVGNGQRAGTREPLRSAQQSGRVRLLSNTLATKLILDHSKRCTGVRCLQGAHLYRADPNDSPSEFDELQVNARREVIVSCGTFNTPQLLLLSGIGPAKETRDMGITAQVDLPGVGRNLQDRYEVGVITRVSHAFSILKGAAFRPPQPGDPPDPALNDWYKGKGPYRTNGAVLAAMAKSAPDLAVPDLFLFALPANFRGYYPGYSQDLELTPDMLTWAVLKAHTNNRAGTVTLRTIDPRDTPDIAFHYFEEGSDVSGADLNALVAGVKFARGVTARLGRRDATEIWPGRDVVSDQALRDWVRDNAWGHHACGTCAIGSDDDQLAVLDSRFRVRGVPGLRVVDASVFPSIPGYFLVTSVYMASEKAAEVILEDASTSSAGWPTEPSTHAFSSTPPDPNTRTSR